MFSFTLEIGWLTGHNILVLFFVGWVGWKTFLSVYRHYFSAIPDIDSPWFLAFAKSKPTRQLIVDAYDKYSTKSRVFKKDNSYILPPSAFDEARKVPSSVFSSSEVIEDSLHLKYFLGNDHTDVVNFVRQSVSSNIKNLVPIIQDEVQHMFRERFPPRDEIPVQTATGKWHHVRLHKELLTGIGCIASRIFVGRHYARDVNWTRTASDWANGIIFQGLLFRHLPEIMIAFVARFMPGMKRFKLLKSILHDEVLEYLTKPIETESVSLSTEKGDEITLLPFLVQLMGLMFAAIDTTTMTTTHLILDLLSNPRSEYADPIRVELETVLGKYGGVWTQQALGELKLLDSFIKESQRMHAIALVLPGRMVMSKSGYTFSQSKTAPNANSIHVPYRSRVFLPLAGVHSDPIIYENPGCFQGFRFVGDPVASSQPSNKFLSFGHGTHACPGRHLALVVIKLMAIELLTKYEWEEMAQRPKDLTFGTANVPDFSATVHVRRRSD
ncbi:cytochrome P450 [Aspergillus pseudodeflectus]|uniref:Cytochrome P450 n=1 Tax=Aspergillus pseudodeflectus TaxID=176178 RepID=A0ABR4JVF1_9EURO